MVKRAFKFYAVSFASAWGDRRDLWSRAEVERRSKAGHIFTILQGSNSKQALIDRWSLGRFL